MGREVLISISPTKQISTARVNAYKEFAIIIKNAVQGAGLQSSELINLVDAIIMEIETMAEANTEQDRVKKSMAAANRKRTKALKVLAESTIASSIYDDLYTQYTQAKQDRNTISNECTRSKATITSLQNSIDILSHDQKLNKMSIEQLRRTCFDLMEQLTRQEREIALLHKKVADLEEKLAVVGEELAYALDRVKEQDLVLAECEKQMGKFKRECTMTQEQLEQLVELHKQGLSIRKIGMDMGGVPKSTVEKWIKYAKNKGHIKV